ncbi:MAG: glycosyltransferase family 4 protein [Anaerolineae bacterium]|nr:glycosyltransferase family 4 protein [Anaerolineae bacterium]
MFTVIIEFRTSTPYPIQLANALTESCDVALLLPHNFPEKLLHGIKPEVRFETFHMPRVRYPTNLWMMYQLSRRIAQFHPDVVHVTAWYPWLTLSRLFFRKFRMIATVHDVHRHPGDAETWPLPDVLYRWQWRGARHIIVHATTAKEELMREHAVAEKKISVIPIGAYDLYQQKGTATFPEQPHTILFFGRIWAYKGLQHLIEAEPIITREVPDAKIIIAGTGEPFERYEQMMINKDRFVVYNQRIPDEMVAELFQTAGLVVLPYLEASQSGVIPVAYAFGKPVVATTVGGIPDIVAHGETGYLVPPGDTASLAQAIIALLTHDEQRQAMGHKALEKSRTELSWADVARKTLGVYENVVHSTN